MRRQHVVLTVNRRRRPKMDAKHRKKARDAIKKIRADMEINPKLRKAVKQNYIRVLAEHGKLNLAEIIEAHDTRCQGSAGSCPATSLTG
jgi:hypothetical protein